jgi:peptidoglycan/LPS O-acetylase OafA/YrhL
VWLLGVVAEKIRNKYNLDETSVVFLCAIALAFSRVDFISTYYDVYRFICFAIFLVPAFIYLTSSSKNLVLFPRWVLILIWLVASYLLWIGNSGQFAKLIIIGMLPTFFLLKVLGFVDVPRIERLLTKISWTGHYSYALYAVHYPLILLVNTINAGWQLKFITAVLASAVAAYFLEDIFQKYINKVVLVAK